MKHKPNRNTKQHMRLVRETQALLEQIHDSLASKSMRLLSNIDEYDFISKNTKLYVSCEHYASREIRVRDIIADTACCRLAKGKLSFPLINLYLRSKNMILHTKLEHCVGTQLVEVSCDHTTPHTVRLIDLYRSVHCCRSSAQQTRVSEGTHHFCKDENGMSPNSKRVKDGTFYGWSDKRLKHIQENPQDILDDCIVCVLQVEKNNHKSVKIGFTSRTVHDRYNRYFDSYDIIREYHTDELNALQLESQLLAASKEHIDWTYHNQEGYGHTEYRKIEHLDFITSQFDAILPKRTLL